MTEATNKEIQKLEKEKQELYKQAQELSNKIKELKAKKLNLDGFEGKYIKYGDGEGYSEYMLVDWVTKETNWYQNFDYAYMFRGLGFYGEFTGYGDATSFDWSYWHEFTIYGDEIEFLNKVKKIQIITKEEFDKAFEDMLEQVIEFHSKYKRNKDE